MTYSTFFDPCSNAGLTLCCTNVKEKAVSCRDLIDVAIVFRTVSMRQY
ncbi:hypothetical protein [Rickettsia endosymbiont of Polydrusus tereticollis]